MSYTRIIAMMAEWRGLLVMIVLTRMACLFGDITFPCKAGQIHWKPNSTSREQYKCLECPSCFEGLEPSVPCGSSVPYNTPVHCVPCQLGKTYSDGNNKEQCKTCRVCSPGKAIKKNCTISSNTECDDKCAPGYYGVPFIFACHPCTKCCNDEKDKFAEECVNSKQKCKVRSLPCKTESTPSSTAGTDGQSTLTAIQTSHKPGKQMSAIPPTLPGNSRVVDDRDKVATFQKDNANSDDNTEIITVAAVFAVLGVLMAIVIVMVLIYQGQIPIDTGLCRCDRSSNDEGAMEAYQLRQLTFTSQGQLQRGGMTLTELESNNQDLFDEICLMLDNGKRWFRSDYERLAAQFKEIPLLIRNNLKSELQRGESPSKLLMTKLQTTYPSLSLCHLVGKLKKIGRNDVVRKLSPYVQDNVESPPN